MKRSEVKALINDFRKFCPKYLKIKDKAGNIVPLVMNKAQEIVLETIEKMIQEGKPIRLIILKARQKGISTIVEAFIFFRTTYKKNRKAAIIGHESDSTDNMWEMTNRYYDNLPMFLQPQKKHHNAKELTFARTKSEVMFWTAEKGDVGSSHTVQDAHLTEVSKWRDAKTTLTALLQTIPDKPNTMVIMESTANGFGGEFHDRWLMAKRGQGNYVPIFLSWLIDDEYTLQFKTEEERERFGTNLDEIEKGLIDKGATLEHLKWRRDIGLPDKCGGDVDKFQQEYPASDMEAFITSGSPFFDVQICSRNYNKEIKPLRVGNLEPLYDGSPEYVKQMSSERNAYYDLLPYLKEVRFIDDPNGFIKIFKEVKLEEGEYNRFCAGCDTSEGLEQGDYDVIDVADRRLTVTGGKLETVLRWHGHIAPDLLAAEQHKIDMYLGKGVYFGTERNKDGLSVIIAAYKLGLNQYYSEDFNKGYGETTDLLGFRTKVDTRMPGLNQLAEWVREGLFEDTDRDFWDECLTFVKDAKGRPAAQGKLKNPGVHCYDDRIMAKMIQIAVHLWMPNYYMSKVEKVPEWMNKLKKKRQTTTIMAAG